MARRSFQLVLGLLVLAGVSVVAVVAFVAARRWAREEALVETLVSSEDDSALAQAALELAGLDPDRCLSLISQRLEVDLGSRKVHFPDRALWGRLVVLPGGMLELAPPILWARSAVLRIGIPARDALCRFLFREANTQEGFARAAELLRDLGAEAIVVATFYETDDETRAVRAASALEILGAAAWSEGMVDPIADVLACHPSSSRRLWAAYLLALAARAGRDVAVALGPGLRDATPDVVVQTCHAVRDTGPSSTIHTERLFELAGDLARAKPTRLAAVRAIGALANPALAPRLRALGATLGPDAQHALEDALERLEGDFD